jgi:hypothetical protein
MTFIRNDIKPVLSATALSHIAALADAETVDDVLSLPFPLPLAPLSEAATFSSFYDATGPSNVKYTVDSECGFLLRQSRTTSGRGSSAHVIAEGEDFKPRQIYALSEAATIMRLVDPNRDRSARFSYCAYMSDRIAHGNYWHLELREANSDGIVVSVSSDNGTIIVPNYAFREILKTSSHAGLLTRPIHDRTTGEALAEFDRGLREKTHPLHAQLKEAAIILADNVVIATSSLTPHRQNHEIREKRVYQKAYRPRPGHDFLFARRPGFLG